LLVFFSLSNHMSVCLSVHPSGPDRTGSEFFVVFFDWAIKENGREF
jgi:hypothetical protein